MSTAYSASVIYGYRLPADELSRKTPNPLWGKHKFDPNTGEKVEQFIQHDISLGLEDGDNLRSCKNFMRMDTSGSVLLGVELGDTGDLSYGGDEPQALKIVTDSARVKTEAEVRKLLEKAGLTFDYDRMGYWLVGQVY